MAFRKKAAGCLLAALLAVHGCSAAVSCSGLDEIQGMLDDLAGDDDARQESGADSEAQSEVPQEDPAENEFPAASGDGSYSILDGYSLTDLNGTVAIQVPSGWGGSSGGAFTSYSPVNQSGALSPSAGTLTTSWFSDSEHDAASALSAYEDGIRKLKYTSDVQSEPTKAANLDASRISFRMTVGTNEFTCKVVCFSYMNAVYAVELDQGSNSADDYFPVFENVVSSMKILDGTWDPSAIPTPEPEPSPETDSRPETESQPQPATDSRPEPESQPETESQPGTVPGFSGDLGAFEYASNGQVYSFPTQASDLSPDALPVSLTMTLSYNQNPGTTDALANTEYFTFENLAGRELVGITNLTGQNAPASEGVITALQDTGGSYISLELPGGLKVGADESAVLASFPAFGNIQKDGVAGLIENDFIYAANIRDDGCTGYVLIKNDAPFYSTVSIICENGNVREICFECLGSAAEGIFL